MLSWASASSSSSHNCMTTHQRQQHQQQQVAAAFPATTHNMYSNSHRHAADVDEKTLPLCCNGNGADCKELSKEQSRKQQHQQHQQQQQYYHQHQQQHQQQQAELITTEATSELIATTAEATEAIPAPARKGRKLRRRRKKSVGSLGDLSCNGDGDAPSVVSTDNGSTTGTPSISSTAKDDGAEETPKPLTRACRRALQHQNQNPNARAGAAVSATARSTRSIISMSSRANPSNSNTASHPSSSNCNNNSNKGKKKGGTYSESAVLKELYVAIRCEFVPGSSNNNASNNASNNNVRRVLLVSWDHQPLWEACLDDNCNNSVANDNDNNDSGASGEWTITEYSNNKSNSSSNKNSSNNPKNNSSNNPKNNSSNNHRNNSKNNSDTILKCETAPSPNLRIWRHQSFQQVRFQLQQQIAARVLIGHGLSKILAAWQLPRHPACNVRDAATFSAYMQERVDPLSVMVVPRSLERDLMLNYLNMNTDANTDTNTDALLQQAVACMMLYQRSRVEWEQDVARWMQQQERQRAIRNERLASLSMSMQHQQQPLEHMCCESFPMDMHLSVAADCWSTAGSNYAEDMEGQAASELPPRTVVPSSSSSKVTRSLELTLTQPTSTVDDDDDEDYDYDGALVAAVESFSTATPIKTQDAAVAVVAAAAAASEWNGWSTPFLSSAPSLRATTTPPTKATKDRTTWGSMLALPPRPKESSHPVSSEDLLAEPIAAPCLNYPLTLLEEEDEEYVGDFGEGAAATDDDVGADTGGHLPSCLLNDSSDEEEDPWREKRGSSHPIDGDDWLDQEDQDQQHQQQQPKVVSQAYWFRRRQSVSPPCVRTDIGGSSKYGTNSNMHKSLNSSERHNSRFPQSPPSKPLSCSERGGRRSFFSPPGSEMPKSPNHITGATTEGENFHPQPETETTTMSLNQSERPNSRFPRSPSKPSSDRVVRRNFFSPLASEMRKSPPHMASATMEEGRNLRARSETETTTTLMDELSTC